MRNTNDGDSVLNASAHHLLYARSGSSVVRVTCEYRVYGTLCECRV
jgi:hypothetical protein